MNRWAISVLMSWLAAGAVLAQQLTIIELRHRRAEEVIPLLQPLVSDTAGLSAADYQLLIRASDADIARIREALRVLDRAAKQLLVSVRYASRGDVENESSRVSGQVGGGDTALAFEARQRTATTRAANVSSVRVIEGQEAHIAKGQNAPVVSAVFAQPSPNRRSHVGVLIEQREISSGFTIRPRISGTNIVLEVAAQQAQATDSRVASQRIQSTVMGQIGEWLALGGVEETEHRRQSTIGARRTETSSDSRQLWIRVEMID